MDKNRMEEGFQDEIWKTNKEGSVNQLVAYWDDELECYIYLLDEEEAESGC